MKYFPGITFNVLYFQKKQMEEERHHPSTHKIWNIFPSRCPNAGRRAFVSV